ncbi:uroporphyrinogen-III synthase [Pseudaestuariivita atlantica]|uniref:uroporphyrinogen-III synthase n=1 Tax=Pseudaestuariivita atlantica TaxID=1317121 RepID=UPI00067CA309|nr:uroporphyrinogen-III synthase [Pseudaestuariivita atlantica]
MQTIPSIHRPVLLLTRQGADNARLTEALPADIRTRVDIVDAPLLDIRYLSDAIDTDDAGSLVFTSRHGVAAAVACFLGRRLPCHVVGARTAEAARDAGFDVQTTARDAEDLLERLEKAPPQAPVLHLRGQHARGNIAKTLSDRGIEAREHVVYEQVSLPLPTAVQAVATGNQPVVIPLFSPRAAMHLAEVWTGSAPVHGVALSPAVARAATEPGWATLDTSSSPDLEGMLTTLVDRIRRLLA